MDEATRAFVKYAFVRFAKFDLLSLELAQLRESRLWWASGVEPPMALPAGHFLAMQFALPDILPTKTGQAFRFRLSFYTFIISNVVD
uniref:Nuclear transport factor 2 family protein n=1 Tax=Steinernema glaseri TaxID=37863 RepID=A0A1I7YNC7_9BILA